MPELWSGPAFDTVSLSALEGGTAHPPSRGEPQTRFARVGKAIPGVSVEVRAETGEEAAPREVGEIVVGGDSLADEVLSADGTTGALSEWCTGDLGYRTDDGDLVVCGRAADRIVVGGRNLHATAVERCAQSLPIVRKGSVAAFEVPSGLGTGALVVAAEAAEVGDDVSRQVADLVASTFSVRPRAVIVLPPGMLPKTTSGKLRRQEIARRYLAGELATPTSL